MDIGGGGGGGWQRSIEKHISRIDIPVFMLHEFLSVFAELLQSLSTLNILFCNMKI
jgi:hypothetical protein